MASATYTLKEHDGVTDVVFSLVGNTADGAVYRVSSRALSLPQGMDIQMQIGNPGAKGNDHIKIIIRNVVRNATTGAVSTGSVTLDLSVPRDSAAWTDTDSQDLLAFVANFLTSGRRESLVDALVP